MIKRNKLRSKILAAALALFLSRGINTEAEERIIESPLSLETTLNMQPEGNNSQRNNIYFSGDLSLGNYSKIVSDLKLEDGKFKKVLLGAGNENIHLGIKFQDLSEETTLLKDSNLFKIEAGVKNDILDLSSFFAVTSIPELKAGWMYWLYYKESINLYSFGLNLNLKKEIKTRDLTLLPWISGDILLNSVTPKERTAQNFFADFSSFPRAFNNFDIGLGINVRTPNFNFNLENYLEGNLNQFMGTRHKIKMGYSILENFIDYSLTINPKLNSEGWKTTLDLESEINFGLNFSNGLFIRGTTNLDHIYLKESNFISALGYSNAGFNIEFFYNLKDELFGVSLSNKRVRNNPDKYFQKDSVVMSAEDPDLFHSRNEGGIHGRWGENISNVIETINREINLGNYYESMNKISEYASYFGYRDHEGTFSAEQEHDIGYGVCRDTNGKLLPTIINEVLGDYGYQSWSRGLLGPYIVHTVVVIKKPNNKFDIMNYNNVHILDAETEWDAIDRVYPGVYAYDGGEYSKTSEIVIDALKEKIWR